jgi:hypothetical protein
MTFLYKNGPSVHRKKNVKVVKNVKVGATTLVVARMYFY